MPLSAKRWVAELSARYRDRASPENAAPMKAYLRNQFEFFGIKTPQRRDLIRGFVKEYGVPELSALEVIVRRLWRLPQRELQHTAMELLQRRGKELTLDHLPLLEMMITEKSWWDTVDFISYKLVGNLLSRHPKKERSIARRFSRSGHLWLIRVSIIFQLLRKEDTDVELLEEMIRRQTDHGDFFVRKAIGWALRDYAYTDPDWVRALVKKLPLSNLSVREALKNL